MGDLQADIPVEAVKSASLAHLRDLMVEEDGKLNWKKTFLSLWRLAPNSPAKGLGALWSQWPADSRSPDHSIWEHLSLTSAFAGALAADESSAPALLVMSFGPVQGFIAQARSVSDLWAGSHFLSRMAWEAMKEICDRYGPDAVLFPNLHGVPAVDVWLYQMLGPKHWKEPSSGGKRLEPEWKVMETDANPLFAATLPNRFVALVPESGAPDLARKIEKKVRRWVQAKAEDALEELLRRAELVSRGDAVDQLERQLGDFPEVNWAVVPWRLAGTEALEDEELQKTLETLGAAPHYLGQGLEPILRRVLTLDDIEFYRPNPGVGYPGLYEALERVHAAAKSVRRFSGSVEEGYRCSLCGEREWLADQRRTNGNKSTGIFCPPGQRTKTLWAKLSSKSPALAKEGEHLCGWCALKRVWPRLFVREVKECVGMEKEPDRFVLSTHAVAVSTSLWRWANSLPEGGLLPPDMTSRLTSWEETVKGHVQNAGEVRPVTLPAKLHRKFRDMGWSPDVIHALKKIPAFLDAVEGEDARRKVVRAFRDCFGLEPETYYALVLMDGDHMGRWLSASGDRPTLGQRFHAETLADLEQSEALRDYLRAPRPASPAWHQAISSALNAFSLHLSRRIVEDLFMGKLIYAGGDDLLAMVAVHDLPTLMLALRCAFSGQLPQGIGHQEFWKKLGTEAGILELGKGYALVKERENKRLLRLMGEKATASVGAVIAHHQAPLARVLGQLRAAERKAKSEGGRDAFCITVCKRSGGTSHLVGKWNLDGGWYGGDMGLLLELRNLLAHDVSRRVAYELSETFRDLPPDTGALAAVMEYQFRRKAKEKEEEGPQVSEFAKSLAFRAFSKDRVNGDDTNGWPRPNLWLRNMVLTAEFLAREGRVGPRMETAEEKR
ncbi:MAG: type III-B CRISPR-associated protein Cas10/Cmr2 [Desulfacinum sp.]|nr:type III-B CRISPR-associated protein Cas10/Cmr2 [Desulfacinum sp.]